MNQNTEEILKIVSDWKGSFCGAYSIRENGQSISRMSSEHIHIEPKKDKPGLDIHVDDVTFAYQEDDPILQNLHLHFDKGKVGPLNISTALLALETVEYAVTNQKWGVKQLLLLPGK